MARKYSLGEIDRMRDDVAWMRSNRDPDATSFPAHAESVEEELRTLMGAGIGPAELRSQRTTREARIAYLTAWTDALTENKQRDCSHGCWAVKHNNHCYRYAGLSSGGCGCSILSCVSCGIYDRRHKKQGRPGGRRKGDTPRTPVKPKTCVFDPPKGYKPCTREAGHGGPCALDLAEGHKLVYWGDPAVGKTQFVVAVDCAQPRPKRRWWHRLCPARVS